MNDLSDEMAADAKPALAPGDNALKSVSSIAERAVALEDEISALEELLKRKNEEYRRITEHELPEAMQDVGMKDFRLNDGSRVEAKPIVRASPKEDMRPAMFRWLRENNLGDIIKTNVTVAFPAGREKEASALCDVIAKVAGENVHPELSEMVHPQTLTAFVRRQLTDGKPLPLATFGVWQGTIAKITRPKG